MKRAHFRFYAELNDLLPPPRQGITIVHTVENTVSLRDVIEALGVPHTEVDLILVNGASADFSRQMQDGDRVSVYPVFRLLDVSPVTRVRPRFEGETRFVLDVHLGRLAAYLRMLGFDSLYRNDHHDEELAQISASEQRILLSRDRGLLRRSIVTHGYLVREPQPRQQLLEVLRRFNLSRSLAPFRRCLRCNAPLQAVAKELIKDRLLPNTRQSYDEFQLCPECDRVYWKGPHYRRMKHMVDSISGASRSV